jgi:LAGLIDADG DNA endonuclease family protein
MTNLLPEEIAYAAGFFDGEGHIAITHNIQADKRKRKNGKVYFYERFQMHIEVSQKDKTPLVWLRAKFGGNLIHGIRKRSYDRGTYSMWYWWLGASKAAEFLKLIQPFLIVKRQEADVAIEFDGTMNRARKHSTTPAVKKLRQAAFDKIRQIRLVK